MENFDLREFWERERDRPRVKIPADNRIKKDLPRKREIIDEKLKPNLSYTEDK